MSWQKCNVGWWSYICLLLGWCLVTPVIHGWLPQQVSGWRYDWLTVAAKGMLWGGLTWWCLGHYRAKLTELPAKLWQFRLPWAFWLSLLGLLAVQTLGQLMRPAPFAVGKLDMGQLINVTLAAGFFEEWFFRGCLLNCLLKTGPFWRVNLMQALAFQVIHFPLYLVMGYSPLVWLGNIACVFPLGLLFGWNYQRSHSIWPSMILHIVWNSSVFFLN
ncbi:Abortive infection protein [Lactobacillus buchneri NRRL B-30929] [Lactiplantibacillus mudanjiangensis]|uniref:CPBP family intramembrane glutamic endopeptidase n=1 Tax=Lactiplantibacillus mudanjiangensis TaxID=1296538 RepID=UPI001015C509|nr:CPBP family intramembrane glutamic endopeptidase [Lactiplantibacillus mudanjiangensis]VDG32194.1 Abortive infection protein [Lactobacillus buchneri NRRL B-30929] [Lactiplantibacillus mudanjiangensis]